MEIKGSSKHYFTEMIKETSENVEQDRHQGYLEFQLIYLIEKMLC